MIADKKSYDLMLGNIQDGRKGGGHCVGNCRSPKREDRKPFGKCIGNCRATDSRLKISW